MKSFDEIEKLVKASADTTINHWKHNSLFTPEWWFMLFLFLIPLFLFKRFWERKRTYELFLMIFISHTIYGLMEGHLINFMFITYNIRLLPVRHAFIPYLSSLFPLLTLIIARYGRTWGRYMIGALIVAILHLCFVQFVLIPFDMLIIFKGNAWIFFFMNLVALLGGRYITLKLLAVSAKTKEQTNYGP